MKKEYLNVIIRTAIVFDKGLNKELLNIYYDILKEYPLKSVKTACRKAIEICKFFPKISEIINFIKEEQPQIKDLAEIQATEVLKQMQECGYCNTPKFTDPVTIELMKHRFNFVSLCKTMKESEIKWFVKEFIQAYQAFNRNRENLLIEEMPSKLKKITNNLFESV